MLLEMIGMPHRVVTPSLEEECIECADPRERVLLLAKEKVQRVKSRLPDAIVLGADTLVVKDGQILEKPVSKDDAARMLGELSGHWHEVYTGLHVEDTGADRKARGCEVTRVKFRRMKKEEIEAYLETGEPMDKAGSYGIQGYGAVFIERVEGCYFNVVGLPLRRLVEILEELGLCFDFRELRRCDRD
jgi:septum formation protein